MKRAKEEEVEEWSNRFMQAIYKMEEDGEDEEVMKRRGVRYKKSASKTRG